MADENSDPPGDAPGDTPKPAPPRRRRPTPTIDLKATEVAVEPQEDTTPEDSAPFASEQTSAAPPPEPPPPSGPKTPGWFPGQIDRRLIEAAAAGGAVALLLLLVFWLAGVFSPQENPSAALDTRLAAVESRLRELSSRPVSAGADAKAVGELAARLDKLEAAAAAPKPGGDPAVAGRLAAVEEAVKTFQGSVAELNRRADDHAAATREARGRADAALIAADAARVAVERSDLATLGNRVTALERSTKGMAEEAAKSIAATGDRPLRLAVSAQALRAAVERGDPFTAELAAVKPLIADPQLLQPLEPYAASGIPSAAALARELSELVPAMSRLTGAAAPAAGGFLDRLQANAERLVRVRPIDEAAGDDPATIISRIEARAARSDISGALAELAKLPPVVRAPAEEWIKKAEARNAAAAASRKLVSEALAALGKSP